MERFIRKARDLDARSSVWLPAGWGIIGIAVTLGALALQAHVFWLGVLTAILLIGAAGCFKADREFNRRHEDDAEELALEMEEAVDVDNLPIPPGSELGSA
jgi:hypothetical protein